ncbi:uncharacterized protein At1g08160 [Cajanus cajan]|uniref:uncharacterized protein At1g08160 n=1 Tax=Cajanus cajan TaxID=3821 RepID=UPI00098D8014|nr:uncharacterized protein At1g08160 [Cajanus cajan]
MLALPPPPPPPPLATRISKQVSPNQTVISKDSKKQTIKQHSQESNAPNYVTPNSIRPPPPTTTPRLRQPQFQRTNPITWFAAVLCLVFSLVLIFFGVATLIIFLGLKPRNPTFDIPNANLNAVYFDSPQYFNGDFILLANITNPNRRIDVRFESLDVDLFFSDRIISTQSIQPFTQRRRESRCQMEMTAPPTGVLVARNCITKR